MTEPLEPLPLMQPKLLGMFTVKIEEMPYDNTDNPIPLYVATGWIAGDKEDENPEDMMGRVEFRMASSELSHAGGKCLQRLVEYAKQYVKIEDAQSSTESPGSQEPEAGATSFGNG